MIPHNPKSPLTSAHIASNDQLILLYSVDVKDELYLHSLSTGSRVKRLASNLIGTIEQFSGRREHKEFWFSMSGFVSPGTVYRYDFEEGEGRVVGNENVYREARVEGIKPDEFESSQVFFESKDGTKVLMFITKPKG